jgi:hypothetical protein
MVCQLRPFVYSLGLNNPPRNCLTPRKSCVKNLWRNKQGNFRCKMAGAGFHWFAKLRDQMCTADHDQNNHTADGHRQEYKFESGLQQAWPDRMYTMLSADLGNPQWTWERFAKGLFLLWQTAVFDRGALQMSASPLSLVLRAGHSLLFPLFAIRSSATSTPLFAIATPLLFRKLQYATRYSLSLLLFHQCCGLHQF